MAGGADHSMHRKTGRFHRLFHHFEMQRDGGLVQPGFARHGQTAPLGDMFRAIQQEVQGAFAHFVRGVPHIQAGDRDTGDYVARARLRLDGPYRCHQS